MAEHGLKQIQHLYKIEHMCDDAGMSFDERKAKRQELSKPIMEAMKLWMETEGLKYSESSLAGKAITYAYTRWDNMMRYLEDGRLLLDNNLAENEIRKELSLLRQPRRSTEHGSSLLTIGYMQEPRCQSEGLSKLCHQSNAISHKGIL